MGRNVSPEWVETSLTARGLIQQAFVHGDGQLQLSALVVSDQSATQIADVIDQVNSSLPDYAQVGSWQLVPAFTIENGTLTGTGKLRRSAIADRYCSKPDTSQIA
jgi:long-chain acyl-CoA synthetase